MHAAHTAGDRPTAANLVSTLSYQVASLDDPHEAVLLARSAATGAREHASTTTRALLGERVAWAHARAGQARHTERALSAVDTDYDRRRPADDPEWVYWLDENEITVMAGRCYVELGQPERAIPLLTGVLALRQTSCTRVRPLHVMARRSTRPSRGCRTRRGTRRAHPGTVQLDEFVPRGRPGHAALPAPRPVPGGPRRARLP
ncbi:MAG: hypothetical protein ACRDTZ_21600 [Pseudonocardiaceae bacterium]